MSPLLFLRSARDGFLLTQCSFVFRLDKAAFAKSADGQTISVTVPCGCMSVRGHAAESPEGESSSLSSQQPAGDAEQCAGEMVVSVTQEIVPEGFSGVAKAMRMTVMISHY